MELGDVTGGLPGLHHQQLLEIRLPLYGLNDSPKRRFLSNLLRNIGWKSSAWMNASLFSLIRNPRFCRGYCVCMWMICCWVVVAQPIVKQSMHCVHVSRFANGKEIKDNSVVAAFPKMFSPKRSLCLRVPAL